MVERWLLAFLARARGSKGGTILVVVGVIVLLAFLVFGLTSALGNAIFMMAGVGPVVEFLGTGQGVLVGFAASVLLILLGVAFLNRATPQPTQSVSVIQQAGTPQTEKDRESEQLHKRLRIAERERDRYHAILSDPAAKKRREKEILRRQCGDVATAVRNFAKAHRSEYQAERETVERFRLRHYEDVEDLRDKLNRHGGLTKEEREALTLRPNDGMRKIAQMADVLGFIAAGW